MPSIDKVCKECQKPFYVTEGEQRWLKEKGFKIFERCFDCRQKRKAEKK